MGVTKSQSEKFGIYGEKKSQDQFHNKFLPTPIDKPERKEALKSF